MKFWNRLLAGILSTSMLCALCPAISSSAAETKASVSVVFTGDEAELAGYAQCEITVTPGSKTESEGYFLVYYTDGAKVLADYDEALAIKINGKNAVKGSITDGHMIPYGAKGLAVFEHSTYFLLESPDIKDAVATYIFPTSKLTPDFGKPEFTFGALADTHMNYEQHDRGAYAKLAHSMDFFAAENMDLVVIAGDATGDRGENPDLEEQYEKHLEILEASDFPADKVYEAIGNHGNTPADAHLLAEYLSGEDEIHPYKSSPYFHLLAEGKDGARDNLFIFMAQEIAKSGDSSKYDNFSKAQIDWLEKLLTQYGNTETNIFILEHSPFLNWGAGDVKNGGYTALITLKEEYTQTMRFYELLKTYRNAVVMSGHTHISFYEDANFSDENNSFARTVHIGSNSQPCGYGTGTKLVRSYDGRKNVTPEYGSEGYAVEVFSDRIVYTGYNFSTGKKIPAACFMMPTVTADGDAEEETKALEGVGTLEDPYLIQSEADFNFLTNSFSTSSVESSMYGKGAYFLQTKDLDMTRISSYRGTVANGNEKYYFAGIYNGGGHTIRVNINDSVQRSVFPYVYGAICNLKIEGNITSETSAQPVRTLYGSIVNCIFRLNLNAKYANGICYSNYGSVYNVFTAGTLTGTNPHPVSNNDSSKDYGNVFHYYTNEGSALTDTYGTRSCDIAAIAAAFNGRGTAFTEAEETLGGFQIMEVSKSGEKLIFAPAVLKCDTNADGALSLDDAIHLLFHVNFPEAYPISQSTDFDGNGTLSLDDAVRLLFHVNFPDAYPLF